MVPGGGEEGPSSSMHDMTAGGQLCPPSTRDLTTPPAHAMPHEVAGNVGVQGDAAPIAMPPIITHVSKPEDDNRRRKRAL